MGWAPGPGVEVAMTDLGLVERISCDVAGSKADWTLPTGVVGVATADRRDAERGTADETSSRVGPATAEGVTAGGECRVARIKAAILKATTSIFAA